MQHSVILIFLVCFIVFNSSCQVKPKKSGVFVIEKCQPIPAIKSGDTLLVKFEEFPGRGYSWQLKQPVGLNDVIIFLGKVKVSPIDSNDDSKQLATFKFVALKKAKYLLQFEYRRPWEKDKPAAQECNIPVDIR
jgi:predicted secreted protein